MPAGGVVSAPVCPQCGLVSVPTVTSHGVRHDCTSCKLHSWGGKPLVDQATHDARQEAHRYFDALWNYGKMTRSDAYKKLAAQMGLHPRDCHISQMTKEQALSVKFAVVQARIQFDLDTVLGWCASHEKGKGKGT